MFSRNIVILILVIILLFICCYNYSLNYNEGFYGDAVESRSFITKGDKGDEGPIGLQGKTGAKGDKGETGTAGKGVNDVRILNDELQIKLTGENDYKILGNVKGDKGDTEIVKVGEETKTITGPKGDPGKKGTDGAQGPAGPAGRGIKQSRIDSDGVLYLTYTGDNQETRIGRVKGRPGDTGPAGADSSIYNRRLKKGMIIAWSGSLVNGDLPKNLLDDNWALCNGENDTPNLSGRFILGSGKPDNTNSSDMHGDKAGYPKDHDFKTGDISGAHKHKLLTDEMPSHTHSGTTEDSGNHDHRIPHVGLPVQGDGPYSLSSSYSNKRVNYIGDHSRVVSQNGVHSHSFTTESTGGNLDHNNMPPYYVLAYIMKTQDDEQIEDVEMAYKNINEALKQNTDRNMRHVVMNVGFKKGMVIAWSGLITNIPKGWGLCDGKAYDESTCSFKNNPGGQPVLFDSEIPSGAGTFGDVNTNYASRVGWGPRSTRKLLKGTVTSEMGKLLEDDNKTADSYHGPFGNGIPQIFKTFKGLPAHDKLIIKFRFFYIDSWDNEVAFLKVDNKLKWRTKPYFYNKIDGRKKFPGKIFTFWSSSGNAGSNTCGTEHCKYYEDIVLEIDHNSETAYIIIGAHLDSGTSDEYWAFNNFEIHTKSNTLSSSGAPTIKFPKEKQQIIYSEIEGNSVNLSYPKDGIGQPYRRLSEKNNWAKQGNWISENTNNLTDIRNMKGKGFDGSRMIMGDVISDKFIHNYAYHGPFAKEHNKGISSTFNLPPHTKLRIKFRYWSVASWDSEKAFMKVDDVEKWSKTYKFSNGSDGNRNGRKEQDLTEFTVYNGVGASNANGEFGALSTYRTFYEDIVEVVDHTNDSVKITIGGELNEVVHNEYWAFNNFELEIITNDNTGQVCTSGYKPDLRGRFILGVNNDNTDLEKRYMNDKDGSETHTLTKDEMPNHTHKDQAGKHFGDFSFNSNPGGSDNHGHVRKQSNRNFLAHYASQQEKYRHLSDSLHKNIKFADPLSTGGNQPHNNMPPYYVLAYIVKLKDDFQQQGEITAGGGQGTGSAKSPGTDIDGNIWIKDLRNLDSGSCKTSAKEFIRKNPDLFEEKDAEIYTFEEIDKTGNYEPISGCSILNQKGIDYEIKTDDSLGQTNSFDYGNKYKNKIIFNSNTIGNSNSSNKSDEFKSHWSKVTDRFPTHIKNFSVDQSNINLGSNNPNSKVGIGTNDPISKLTVQDDTLDKSSFDTYDPMKSQLIIKDQSQRLYLGSYFEKGIYSGGVIQASDVYPDVNGAPIKDHPQELQLNPKGGDVKIGNKLCIGNTCIDESHLKKIVNTNQEMVHERVLFGWNSGVNSGYEFEFGNVEKQIPQYAYGITLTGYGMPTMKPGVKERKHRLYAVFNDSIAKQGVVEVEIRVGETKNADKTIKTPAKNIKFVLGATWGVPKSNWSRDAYSEFKPTSAFGSGYHSTIWIKCTGLTSADGDPGGVLKWLTLQTWDFY